MGNMGGHGATVPTRALSRRVRACFGHFFDVRDVDEFCTSKMCYQCGQEFLTGMRLVRCKKTGEMVWRPDRDVKWCNSPQCLGSHPCRADPALLLDARPPKGVKNAMPVDRDQGAALTMAYLVGKPNDQRPPAFRRPPRKE